MSLMENDDQGKYLCVRFSQDSTSLCVGTRSGYQLIKFQTIDELKSISGCAEEEVYIVVKLFTNLLAYVSLQSPRKLSFLRISDEDGVSCNIDPRCYPNSILGVQISRKRIVVVLEDAIYIHEGTPDSTFMSIKHKIKKTPCNMRGLVALSPSQQNSLLAYPGGPNTGELIIFDCFNIVDKIIIQAHDNPLAAMSFDQTGEKIATASEKGTIIRVHQVSDGTCLYECRRGFTRCANIYSLSFGLNALFLCASSSTETIHIFKLETPRPKDESTSWLEYLGRASEYYLPANISKIFSQERSFAYARLPVKDLKTVASIVTVDGIPWLVVASYDGYVYIYNFNLAEGGECSLVRQRKLSDLPAFKPERRSSFTVYEAPRNEVATIPVTSMD